MRTLTLSNKISILKQDVDLNEVRFKFTYPNPKFFQNTRLGFSNFGVPRDIPLFSETGEKICFPRGLVVGVFDLQADFEFNDETITNPVQFKRSKIILKPYQKPALEALLKCHQGLLCAPPAAVKTVMLLETLLRRSQRSLILVHTRDLPKQWCRRIEKFTDLKPGIIDADRHDLQDLTVAMVQSLRKSLDPSFVKQWGAVLLDECHQAPAYTFEQLLNQFPAKYRYGCTATPNRRDGLSFVLHTVVGPTLYRIGKQDLFASGEIMRHVIRVVTTNFFNPRIADYRDLLECVVRNRGRNDLILSHIFEEAKVGHYCLVLSNRIEHDEKLRARVAEMGLPSEVLTSRVAKGSREEIINWMNAGDLHVFCTTQLADEGLDMRRLDRLFLTCPIRSTNRVSQQVGRILRTFPAKHDAVVYDFRDHLCSLAESQFRTRLKAVYERSGHKVEMM